MNNQESKQMGEKEREREHSEPVDEYEVLNNAYSYYNNGTNYEKDDVVNTVQQYHIESDLQNQSQLVLLIDNASVRTFVMLRKGLHYVFGKRVNTNGVVYPPYMLTFIDIQSVNHFIEMDLINNDLLNNKHFDFYVYNFNNLKHKREHLLTYEFFEEWLDDEYLISTKMNAELNREHLPKYLRSQV